MNKTRVRSRCAATQAFSFAKKFSCARRGAKSRSWPCAWEERQSGLAPDDGQVSCFIDDLYMSHSLSIHIYRTYNTQTLH